MKNGTGEAAKGSSCVDPAREEREMFQVLELTEKLIRLKLALGEKMKEGHFDIAAARYSRPHAGIGPAQYDMNMEAQTTLATATTTTTTTRSSRVAEEEGEGKKRVTTTEWSEASGPDGGRGEPPPTMPSPEWYRFEVMDTSSSLSSSLSSKATTGGRSDAARRFGGAVSESTVRRRVGGGVDISRVDSKVGGGHGGGVDGSIGAIADGQRAAAGERALKDGSVGGGEDGSAAPAAKLRKPVDWFGAMAPPQLRRAEKSFRGALELVAQIATVSSKLRALTAEKNPPPDEGLVAAA